MKTDADVIASDLDWLISVDDHLIEPPDVWRSQAASVDRDRVPHIEYADGTMFWAYEDRRVPVSGAIAQAGRPKDEISGAPVTYEQMRPGYYDPVARLEDMDRDGVLASLCFPFFPRFCGQTFYEATDRDLAQWCVTAYNDWIIDGWSASAPGRYLPLIILPLWDPNAAAKEIERCAAKGAKAIAFSENPSKLGLPSIHDADRFWHPVFAAANETGLPLAIHFGSSSSVPETSPDAPGLVSGTLSPISLAYCMTDWMWSGLLWEYDNLKLLMSEGGIGWIPYMVERMENIIRHHPQHEKGDYKFNLATGKGEPTGRGGIVFKQSPTEMFNGHIFGCFIDDVYGCRHLEEIGVDNVLIETDYPHGDSSFPNSIENARTQLADYSDDVKYKIMQGNARALFRLDPSIVQPPSAAADRRS